jgi:hypothetical protein
MGAGLPPPVQSDTLRDILPDNLRTQAKGWKPAYDNITRGDLMRLGGWMNFRPGTTQPDPSVSTTMLQLAPSDLITIAHILEEHNILTYGHSVYFCCTCV